MFNLFFQLIGIKSWTTNASNDASQNILYFVVKCVTSKAIVPEVIEDVMNEQVDVHGVKEVVVGNIVIIACSRGNCCRRRL